MASTSQRSGQRVSHDVYRPEVSRLSATKLCFFLNIRTLDHVKREMKVLPKDTTETALRAIERQKELQAEAGASEGDLVVGAPCKNSGCKAV